MGSRKRRKLDDDQPVGCGRVRSEAGCPVHFGKFRDTGANSITGFTGLTDASVVVLLANGKQIAGHNLWYAGRPNAAGADAGFDFRFEGGGGTIMEIRA